MYLYKQSTVYLLCLYCIAKLLLLLRWDTGAVKDRFGGMGRFKSEFRCKGWVKSTIINVITEITPPRIPPQFEPWLQMYLHAGIFTNISTRFKVQGFFICHIINYTGYN